MLYSAAQITPGLCQLSKQTYALLFTSFLPKSISWVFTKHYIYIFFQYCLNTHNNNVAIT